EGEQIRPALIPDLEDVREAAGNEEQDRAALPFEQRIRGPGRCEAHPQRGEGLVRARSSDQPGGQNRRFLAGPQLDARTRREIGEVLTAPYGSVRVGALHDPRPETLVVERPQLEATQAPPENLPPSLELQRPRVERLAEIRSKRARAQDLRDVDPPLRIA